MITRVVLDDLKIHDVADGALPYGIEQDGIDGLGTLNIRVSAYERAGEEGGHIASAFPGMRPLTISGVVRGSDAANFEANRLALEQRTYIARDSNGRPLLKYLYVTTHTGSEYMVSCLVRKITVGVQHNNVAPFFIELLCPDAYLMATTSTSSGQVNRPILIGADFPWIFNPTIEFGTSSGGTFSIENEGTADTWPVITFRGVLTTPRLTHTGTGRYIELETTLGASDVLVVDMRQKTIVLNDAANYLSTRTLESDWYALHPGTNPFRFSTSNVSDTGTVEVRASAAFLAV